MKRLISRRQLLRHSALALGILGASNTPAFAQAWTPARGEGTVAIQIQDAFVRYHQLPTVRVDRGPIHSQTLLVDFTYGLTDRAAFSVALPYVQSKYDGERPHSALDSPHNYHSTFQDFRFDFRYNLSRKGFVVTPFFGTILPSHGYTYFAHSAAGRHVREVQAGVNFATLMDRVVPGLFVQGRYSYGFAEKILGISHNRSILDAEVGYFVNPALRVFALGSGQLTHGGVDLNGNSLVTLGPVLYPHHDQIGRENVLNVGAGAAYDLSPTVGIYGSVMRTVAGRNVHALQYAAAMGMTWTFLKGDNRPRANHATLQSQAQSKGQALGKCICQKGM